MPQDICIASMAQKKSAYTIFEPQTARTEEPFYVLYQLMTSPQVGYPPSRIVLWGPSS